MPPTLLGRGESLPLFDPSFWVLQISTETFPLHHLYSCKAVVLALGETVTLALGQVEIKLFGECLTIRKEVRAPCFN